MTREYADGPGTGWVMRCDRPGCTTRSERFPASPRLSLFMERGWFIAKLWGDRCPTCVDAGLVDDVEPYQGPESAMAKVVDKP